MLGAALGRPLVAMAVFIRQGREAGNAKKGLSVKPSIRDIEWVVCTKFNIRRDVLRGPSRAMLSVRPRQICMALIRELTGASYPKIARHFSGRDHTTALSAVRRVQWLCATNPKVIGYVEECRQASLLAALSRPAVEPQNVLAVPHIECGHTSPSA